MLRRTLITLTMIAVLLGCRESALHIKIQYDQIQGLKKGDRVIFEENHIGEVTGVFYSAEGYYLVDTAIQREFANAVTEHSKFFIVADPQDMRTRAIEMTLTQTGGSRLQNDAVVQGSSKTSEAFSQMKDNLEEGFSDLKEQFEQFFQDLRKVPESKEFKELEEELERLGEEMARAGKSGREKIQKELLPRLKQEMERLREKLRNLGREEELEPLETKVEELTKT